MFSQVISRYVFLSAFVWTEEISRYFVILMAFTGFSHCIRTGSHLRIDMLENLFPKLKKPLEFFGDAVVVAFIIYMMRHGFEQVQLVYRTGQTSPAVGVPFFIVYLPLAVAFVLGLIRMAERYIKYFLSLRELRKEKGLKVE
jgi:TRAP-type C4-dicarboxylate transport system permease small subunit